MINKKKEFVKRDLENFYIVADGFKYGADFVLYKNSMQEEHGFALVFVKNSVISVSQNEKTLILRICESVKKEGIIAYVNEAANAIIYKHIRRKQIQ